MAQVASFSMIPLDISDFPARHNYGRGLWQNHIERILAGWAGELAVPVYRGRGHDPAGAPSSENPVGGLAAGTDPGGEFGMASYGMASYGTAHDEPGSCRAV